MFKKGVIALALLTFSPVRAACLLDGIELTASDMPQLTVFELPYEWLLL